MSAPPSALDRLEELVSRAGDRLAELHRENAELRERVATLEREVAEHAADSAPGLEAEREELVERVEKLVSGLDELLASVETS